MGARGSVSFPAALALVVTALLAGVLASLAIRPPGVAAPAARAGPQAAALEPLDWRVHAAFNTRLPVLGSTIVHVAERLELASAGRMRFQVFEPGELAPAFAATESVRSGKVDAAYSWLGYDQGRIPAAALLGAVPFGMEPPEYLAWWYHGEGAALARELYAPHGVHLLLCGLSGPETAGWFREPLETAEDLQGLKIRFSGLAGRVLQRLGASVTVLPGGEIFQALEKGAIDASEFSQPVIDDRLGFDRVVKLNYFPGWHQTFSAYHLLVGRARWESLPEATRTLIESVCGAGTLWNYAFSEAAQGPVLADFAARGVEVRTLPGPVLRALAEATRAVLDEEAERDPWFARILASQRAFTETYRRWELRAYLPRAFEQDGDHGG